MPWERSTAYLICIIYTYIIIWSYNHIYIYTYKYILYMPVYLVYVAQLPPISVPPCVPFRLKLHLKRIEKAKNATSPWGFGLWAFGTGPHGPNLQPRWSQPCWPVRMAEWRPVRVCWSGTCPTGRTWGIGGVKDFNHWMMNANYFFCLAVQV